MNLLEDLQTAYQQLSLRETMQLPAKTTSFSIVPRVREYAFSTLQQRYWLTSPEAR